MGQLEVLPRAVGLAWTVFFAVCGAAAEDVVKVPTFQLVSSALTALMAEQLCKGFGIDHNTLNRFLVDNGITAIELSSKGPFGLNC
jgi:hypothetical protein